MKTEQPLEKKRDGTVRGKRSGAPAAETGLDLPPPQTPQQALARIEIPQDVIDQISALIVPGSSLVVSDLGLGEETGEGTDFVVVTPVVPPVAKSPGRRADSASYYQDAPARRHRQPAVPARER